MEDEDVDKRMLSELDQGGRRTIDDLRTATGFDRERIGASLGRLESKELANHISLEGIPRFFACAAKVPPAKVRMYHARPKVPCPKCKKLFDKSVASRHEANCKGPLELVGVSVVEKAVSNTPIQTVKVPCPNCGGLYDRRGLGPHKRHCKGPIERPTDFKVDEYQPVPIKVGVPCSVCGKLCDPRGLGAHERHCKNPPKIPPLSIEEAPCPTGGEVMESCVARAMENCAHIMHPEYTADYVIAGPPLVQPVPDAPTVSPPAPESVYDRSLRLQRLGDMVGTTHWDAFLGPEKRREYVSGFTHGFKHGYEHRIKEEEDMQ